MFGNFKNEVVTAESVEANAEIHLLGQKLVMAFHNKQDVATIKNLVQEQAPVNYRLDYGLEVRLESEFVAGFFILMGGCEQNGIPLEAAELMVGNENALGLKQYVDTGLTIFRMLSDKTANQQIIPVSTDFKSHLINNAIHLRANPDHKNGSLIVAAGLRDPILAQSLMEQGKTQAVFPQDNGAAVNFEGYFGDTAAIWSAILLDHPTLKVLLESGAKQSSLGVSQSSLLHWVAAVSRLDDTLERRHRVIDVAQLLLEHNANPEDLNIFKKTSFDYASEELKQYIQSQQIQINNQISMTNKL